ncbi:MAG: hypothetical protein WBP29_04815 [Candidatus Zixiibacteriota bacterium]
MNFVRLMTIMVAAVMLSCSDSETPPEPAPPIDANFFDGDLEAGYYCFCWDQRYNENLATAGDYKLRMVAGSYDNSFAFTIRQSGPHRTPPECCDTATTSIMRIEKVAKDPPEFFGAALDTNSYASGDTIHVEIAVPAMERVKLEISSNSTK